MGTVYVYFPPEEVNFAIEQPGSSDWCLYDLPSKFKRFRPLGKGEATSHWIRLNNMKTKDMVTFIDSCGVGQQVKTYNTPFARAARILKQGLPDNVAVNSRVLMYWSRSDVMSFARRIQKEVNGLIDLPAV